MMQKYSEFLSKLEKARSAAVPVQNPVSAPDPAPSPAPVQEQPPVEDSLPDAPEARQQHLEDIANQIIAGALESLKSEMDTSEADPLPETETPEQFDDSSDTKVYSIKDIQSAEESANPSPKFDFDDLKFGSNFDNENN